MKKVSFEQMRNQTSELEEVTVQNLVFDRPLYEPSKVEDPLTIRNLFRIGATIIDGYCCECGKESVFHSTSRFENEDKKMHVSSYNGVWGAVFTCQRHADHKIHIIFEIDVVSEYQKSNYGKSLKEIIAGSIVKIGQSPSHADISNGGLSAYKKVLNGIDRTEFVRANGLAAHGVNIGSFVYLRRVFERLLHRARERAGENIDREAFESSRVAEKIEILSEYLPPFMAENTRVYGILSKGIHELDEKTCGKLYSLLKQSCLLMLEQEKDLAEQRALEDELSKSIASIVL